MVFEMIGSHNAPNRLYIVKDVGGHVGVMSRIGGGCSQSGVVWSGITVEMSVRGFER